MCDGRMEPRNYTVEYDENSVAWLIDHLTNARIALQHGHIVRCVIVAEPRYAPGAQPHATDQT